MAFKIGGEMINYEFRPEMMNSLDFINNCHVRVAS